MTKPKTDYQKFLKFLKKNKCPDFIIHNIGGTLQHKSPLSEYTKWLDVINFNVGVAIKINNTLIPKMKKSGNHKIVHVSSISGDSLRGSAPYVCSKNFLNNPSCATPKYFVLQPIPSPF